MSTQTTRTVAVADPAVRPNGYDARTTPAHPSPRSGRNRAVEPFMIVSIVGVTAFGLFCLIPLWMILAGSFTAESTLARQGWSLWPAPFSLDAYAAIFTGDALIKAYGATLFITIAGTILSLAVTAGLAWVIARRMPLVSRPLMVFSYIPLLFSGGLVPMYLLITQYLHLQNTWWAVILPHLVAPFLVFLAASFFRQLPEEIIEAARIDGAGELRTFFTIVLPLSKPILAVVGLFYAVTYWNEWFNSILFLSDRDLFPLQLLLQNLISNVTNAAMLPGSSVAAPPIYQLRLALTVVTIGPILLAYPFAQRYFVKGLTLGATKG